ncbi:hypothetical protein ZWY2020_031178 [Hordeum vulgare]|nr:hypothetical protein ZWY2020_031178 [Hordeum vulgare]
MAAEAPPPPPSSSSSAPARQAPAGAASPETYLGSLISLTSKSEISASVLYNINTEESSRPRHGENHPPPPLPLTPRTAFTPLPIPQMRSSQP